MRVFFMKSWFAFLIVGLAAAGSGCGPDQPDRNVILISIDTLRPDRLGCYGYERDTSPCIDSIASDGILFTDATSACPWTLPAHATLLTGLYPSRHGVKNHENQLPDRIPTLATRLAQEGYATMAVVNSHNFDERYGLQQGFEKYEYLSEWPADGTKGRILNRGTEIAALAREWLKDRDDRPFFLFLHFFDVHSGYTPDPAYRELFADDYAGRVDGSTGMMVALRNQNIVLDGPDLDHLNALYDAEIRQFDDILAGLIGFIDESGIGEETLLVITADHGEEFYEHGSVLHGRTFYQEVIAVPLIVKGPGVPGGVRFEEPVSSIDVAPTVLEYLGLAAGDGMDGVDLARFWDAEESAPADRLLFAEADHMNAEPDMYRMVRRNRYKLCFDRVSEEVSLFDLSLDPGETNDLSGSSSREVNALLDQVKAFMAGEVDGDYIGKPSDDDMERLRKIGYVK